MRPCTCSCLPLSAAVAIPYCYSSPAAPCTHAPCHTPYAPPHAPSQGCTAVHKLKDNLNIFHELAGPVFPPRELRANYLVQEILDRIQEHNRN